jgi:pyruvate,water dikinase
MILPIKTDSADLNTVGGKGHNLALLAQAGFPVPPGFLITTRAYRAFVMVNDLGGRIIDRIATAPRDDPDALQAAADDIHSWFLEGALPTDLIAIIREAYTSLGEPPVAVRSSATAEDLPEMSFAGQQETFLNVEGEYRLLKAVIGCWSSLWTARAISYRARNEIPHKDVALAVVVQEMVPSESSGVLFTANPLTGLRTETVIDATLGLGEALVGGHVEPDHYVVDTAGRTIRQKTLGAKSIAIYGEAGGGVITQKIDAAKLQALPDEQILALTRLGQQIAATYAFPQDIEWAYAKNHLYILQSRPITSLFPIPAGMGAEPLQILFSFGSVQGLLDPMTPLGMDAIRLLFAGGASLFDYQRNHETQGVIKIAGERLWANLTAVLRSSNGRRIAIIMMKGVDPGAVPVLEALREESQWAAGSGRFRLTTFRRIVAFYLRLLRQVLPSLRRPEGRAEQIIQAAQGELEKLQAQTGIPGVEKAKLSHRLAVFRELYGGFHYVVPIMANAVAGLLPLAILIRLSGHLTGSRDLALAITRGIPHNVTTEMDLDLWSTSLAIRNDPEASQHIIAHHAQQLSEEYMAGTLPATAQVSIKKFLIRYGMRGIGEIDIGRPRWREEPTHIMQVVKSYLDIETEEQAPDSVLQRGAEVAAAAQADLEAAARATFGGALKVRLIRAAARRVRALSGLREAPKFHIIQMMGIIRKGLLEIGQDLAAAGILEKPDDLFYFYLNELDEMAQGQTRDWHALAAERRANYARELRRRQVPRLLFSDGRAFYQGLSSTSKEEGVLIGSPVSPGVVTGTVRVVLDPHGAQLKPGEILVCPGTDPAWTPLFLVAGGLVMEVGGMMTHGAIIAREYGIPAVVGVDRATTSLQTGQHIQVDGSSGRILIK